MSERRPLRVVHTSDVHLGAYSGSADPKWAARRELMEGAFSRVIDLANDVAADVLLICGDFFDNDRLEDETARFAASQINRFTGRTYIVPGNHDPMDAGRVYWRYDFEAMAPRLRIIRDHAGEVLEDPEHDLVLWGRGYLESDWHFRPLEGLPARLDGRWHIALAHGHYVKSEGDHSRSLLIHQGEVEAMAGQWDYLALGHWEPHADVSSGGMTAVYSGAPLALSDSNRKAGWAAVIDFDAAGVRWRTEAVDPRLLEAQP
jgi:DNA repair exonuclease SbcCD nuclease subunit